MAALPERASRRNNTRKRRDRKLVVGDNVEVRSTEEGLAGSWHLATVIECCELTRLVRYNHILADDGNGHYTELVKVSSMVDGVIPDIGVPVSYRGVIRPLPPSFEIQCWGFYYGLCVDAYVKDGWWEGVIFDYKDGSDERSVFFPDQGDEEMVKIQNLRVTHDWEEVSESWKMRGNWLFLELIEELEKELFVSVSLKQLWYDVRTKEAFRESIKEWTCWVRPMWDDLVLEVIRNNINLTAEHFLAIIESENAVNLIEGPSKRTRISSSYLPDPTLPYEGVLEDHVEENQLALTSPKETRWKRKSDSSNMNKTKKIKGSFEVKSGGQIDKGGTLRIQIVKDSNGRACAIKGSLGNLPSNNVNGNLGPANDLLEDGVCDSRAIYLREGDFDHSCTSIHSDPNLFTQRSSVTDDKGSLRDDMLEMQKGRAVQDALVNYLRIAKNKSCPIEKFAKKRAMADAKMCLVDMGWKILPFRDHNNYLRVRYISPEGNTFYSVITVCENLVTSFDSSVQQPPFPEVFQHGTSGCGASPLRKGKALDYFKKETGAMGGVSPLSEPRAVTLVVSLAARKHPVLTTPRDTKAQVMPVGETLKKKRLLADADSVMVLKPEYCPQAVVELYGLGPKPKKEDADNLRLKAKQHLLAMGWTLQYAKKNEVRYTSPPPNRKAYRSLRTACEGCIEQGLSEGPRSMRGVIIDGETKDQPTSAIVCTEVEEYLLPGHRQSRNNCTEISGLSESGEFEFGNFDAQTVRRPWKRRKDNSLSFTSRLLQSNRNASSSDTRQSRMSLAVSCSSPPGQTLGQNPSSKKKKRKKVHVLNRKGNSLDGSYPSHVLRSNKRARQIVASNPAYYTPRTILSWLIDNNVVLPREKVYYKRRNQQLPMAEGRITRDGIKCGCCQKVFGISSFEKHAGSTYRRPAANIFLEDGRSLLDCQKQMVQDSKLTGCTSEAYQRVKSKLIHVKNDCICSVCHYGGILVLCDQCPSAFHLSCVGLENLPKGKWFCPSCRCGICGQSDFNGNINQFTNRTVLYCDQCEREYHVGCLRKRGMAKLDCCPKEIWFCSEICGKIFVGLHKLLGKSVPVGIGNLSWTIFKFSKDGYDEDAFAETMTEHHSKLNVALAVMHECFEPIKEPQTKDLVKDVLFNRRSILKRLDFRGFYTVLLEEEDELISVATVRVYGGKVAEVPLVGTRVQYRRQGMCRILMNLLEKKLAEFEVERLLLPAIPQVLHAWTTSFGFSKMTHFERLEFLEYTFLDFQDTTMCQKFLRAHEHGQGMEQNDTLQQKPVEFPGTLADDTISPISAVITPIQMMWSNYENCPTESGDKPDEEGEASTNKECFKYYRRRRTYTSYSHEPPVSLPAA